MLKAVLIDLDNTMVLYDELVFYELYFSSVSTFFTDVFPPDQFQERVIQAALALRHQDGLRKNRESFMDHFLNGYEGSIEDIWQRFESYYADEFTKLTLPVDVPQGLQATLDRLQTLDLKLVLASNPLFPPSALKVRMAWAGIHMARFAFSTDLENMSYVKPQEAYYTQVAQFIGEAPSQCLMVGNDPINDLVAAKVGMKTYLTTEAEDVDYTVLRPTTDHLDPPQDIPPPDFEGPFRKIVDAVEQLRA